MRYVVATIGGLLIMAGAFIGILVVPVVLFPVVYETIPGLVAMYGIAVPLAILAGLTSFRATLRHYARQEVGTRLVLERPVLDEKVNANLRAKWGENLSAPNNLPPERGEEIRPAETRTMRDELGS